jgi:ferrous iron transport protein B
VLEDRAATLIQVVDASHLERTLPLALQLIALGRPMVVACNLMDEARRSGAAPDLALLAERLGVPVVGTVAVSGEGVEELARAASAATAPLDGWSVPEPFAGVVRALADALPEGESASQRLLLAELALSGDEESAAHAARSGGLDRWSAERDERWGGAGNFAVELAMARRRMALALLDGVLPRSGAAALRRQKALDRILLSPWAGVPLVALVLYFGFYKLVGGLGAGVLVDQIESAFTLWIGPAAERATAALLPWRAIGDLVAGPYGLVTLGLRYALAIVLPIVTIFFLVFAVLEDSGYLPRLALLMDRALKRLGLSGRAVIPMVLGFGCVTMATLVTRTLETRRERVIATLLLALAIPCSAQLGVVLGILSASPAGLVVWALVLTLVFLAVGRLAALAMPGAPPSFYLELPPMRRPRLANVLVKTGTRVRWYLAEILPLFLLASVLLWAGELTGLLALATAGLEPVVGAIGLPEAAAPALLYGFLRRDFGAAGLYDLARQGALTPAGLTTAAVTITLLVPCVAQFLMMRKERGLRVALLVLAVATLAAFSAGGAVGWLLRAVGGWS